MGGGIGFGSRGPHTIGRRRAGSAAAAVLIAIGADTAAAQTVDFSRDDYASSSGARAIVSADFNRDGWPDVAHANSGRNTVTILLNRAGAALTRAAEIPVGAGPFDLTTGDFNRDAIPDLAVANADGNTISVLLGKGDGTFTRSDIATPSQNPRGIAVADVNGDGNPDLIYSGYASGVVQVLNGDGAGGFTTGASSLRAGSHPQGVAAADFDRDGRPDIAVAYADASGLRILYNSGAAFTARSVSAGTSLNVVATGDFTGDGWIDVAAASTANSSVTIYAGSAAGLTRAHTYTVGSSPRGIAAADVNSDGALDVVTANRAANTVSVLLGDTAHRGSFVPRLDVASGPGSRAIAVADLDLDGRLDIATGNEFAASATVLSNRTVLAPAAYSMRRLPIGADLSSADDAVWTADFNRDGRPDLVTGGLVILNGGASFGAPGGSVVAVADVNGDGNPDLVYAQWSPTFSVGVELGDGHGGFTAGPTSTWEQILGCAAGDINRDGRLDLACVGIGVGNPVADRAYFLQVALGRGDGTFVRNGAALVLPDDPWKVALADVNRDGTLDAVVSLSEFHRNQGAELLLFFGSDRGTLSPSAWTMAFANDFAVDFDLADVNRDGRVDLVGVGPNSGVFFAPGSTDGFGPAVPSAVSGGDVFGAIVVADLNRDGRPDVALESGLLLFGNGDGTFASGGRFDFGGGLQITDFNGDGLPDIVATSSSHGAVVLANTRDTVNHPPTVEPLPDATIAFASTFTGEDCDVGVTAVAADADAHFLTYEWTVDDGSWFQGGPEIGFCGPLPGSYVYTVRVSDGRGGVVSESFTLTIESAKEIVLWASDARGTGAVEGGWTFIADPSAAGGVRAYDPNRGAAKVTAPIPYGQPANRLTLRFSPDPRLTYKLWIRLKADANSWANDSVWVQFFGATDLAGNPAYETGSTSGLAVNLEECSGCGESAWGWEDDGWGAPNKNGVRLRFPETPDRDAHGITIQTREDGVSIDQVVLSAEKYLTTRPGAAKNDSTVLPSTEPPR